MSAFGFWVVSELTACCTIGNPIPGSGRLNPAIPVVSPSHTVFVVLEVRERLIR